MADSRFFHVAGPFSVAELAAQTGARIVGAGDTTLMLDDVSAIDSAGPSHLSFLSNKKYAEQFATTKAGAIFVTEAVAERAPDNLTLLVAADPYLAFANATQLFYPRAVEASSIAASAFVAADASIGDGVSIGHHAVVESGAVIGDRTRIGSNTVVQAGAVIGADCDISSNVTLSHCIIGDRVTIYPGARIGQDGFGFATDAAGKHVRIRQLGRVLIGDDVEIGANCTVDRGAGPDTVIGPGCMIDNLVQIGHNAALGRGCIMVAQSGVSGSTKLGDFVVVGGQVGIAGHLSIGSGAKLGAKAGVMRDIEPGATVGGIPSVPMVQWLRQTAILEKLSRRRDK